MIPRLPLTHQWQRRGQKLRPARTAGKIERHYEQKALRGTGGDDSPKPATR